LYSYRGKEVEGEAEEEMGKGGGGSRG